MKPSNLGLLTLWCLAGAVMLSTTAARSANTSTADLTFDPAQSIVLPTPDTTGGAPLMAALLNRLNLVYVSDGRKMAAVENEIDRARYDGTHAGIVAQNVYLYAASAGLGTVLRAMVDRAALAEALGLDASQRVVMAQTVGYPLTAAP